MNAQLTGSQIGLLSVLSSGWRPLTPSDWDDIASDLEVLVDLGLVSTDYSGGLEVEVPTGTEEGILA